MKTKITVMSFMVCFGLLAAAQIFAQATNASRVAVINMQQAILDCTEGKKAADTLKAKYEAKAAELQKKKQEIDDLTTELKKQEKTLTEDALAEKQKTIDAKTKELTRAGEDANNEFQQLQSAAINTIGNKMLKVIRAYAHEQNFTLVVDNSSPQAGILYATPSSDITTEIVRRFDAQSSGAGAPKPTAPPAAAPKK